MIHKDENSQSVSREAFEAWARKTIGRTYRSAMPGDTAYYEDNLTEKCWIAWQASRSQALEEAAKVVDQFVGSDPISAEIRALKEQG